MEDFYRSFWAPFIIGISVGMIAIALLLNQFPNNKWGIEGYRRGVRDCQANKVELQVDTTIVVPNP